MIAVISRRGFLKGLLGVTLAGLSLGGYAFGVEPALRLRVQRWPVRVAGWTRAPLRIVALSDLHLGAPHVSLSRLGRIVERANALAPDLAVLLGDYAAGHRFVTAPVRIAAQSGSRNTTKAKMPIGVSAEMNSCGRYWPK